MAAAEKSEAAASYTSFRRMPNIYFGLKGFTPFFYIFHSVCYATISTKAHCNNCNIMNGKKNEKFFNAQQTKQIYHFKIIKRNVV